jgi:hypothetical protein
MESNDAIFSSKSFFVGDSIIVERRDMIKTRIYIV